MDELPKQVIFISDGKPSRKISVVPNRGTKNSDLKLSDRVWVCPVCGCILDRDYNAALNLRDYFTEVISEEKYKNTVGTAEIHASGEKTATLREIFSQVGSLNEEKKPLNL